ncbi:DUF4397 domain-containing protein [Thermaerobacillus caldiproteolyticus]|uniref:DUF4397 domain-containing protein n=1 Tax=Thermaerobacillus caldiproteolyticus TaxID=247480 RepID=UPI001E5A56A3|nr:DUF4397 domain-containing protein [Anoxybacillus caldiproteolyticus]
MMHHQEKATGMYAQKAVMYDLLACYYKYRDPQKHMMYYQKHYEYMKKLMEAYHEREQDEDVKTAMVRVFHASPTATAVDVYVNGQKILQGFKYKQISQYVKVPTGEYRIEIYPSGQTDRPVLRQTVYILPSLRYTLTVIDTVDRLRLFSFFDNPYVSYGETKVRFAHLSPNAPAVDITVKGRDVLFDNVRYRQVTDYKKVPVNERLDLEVRLAETSEVVLLVPNVRFGANKSYTIAATGLVKGSPELKVVLMEE